MSSEGEYPFQGAAWEECWVVLSEGSDNELAKCRGRNMILQEPYTRSISLILHEMGHVYTYTNAIHSYPGPEAIAWLYFDHPQFCAPSELYADALVGTVYSAAGETNRHWWGYWDACSHYPNAERAPTPQAALAEMQLVLNGEYPEWLDDTYADEQGNLDLVGLWDQVQRFGRFRDVVSYGLRNEFGGYCSNYWVRLDLMLGYHDQLNPWRAGGCLPSAPRDVNVVAGDGQVIVKWKEPLQEGALPISHYRIQWKELGADYYSPYDLHRPNELAREDTISRLSNGVTYKVRVAAAHPNLNVGVQRSGIGAWVELTVTPRVNSRATGPPAISGITHTGQTLTVDTSGIVDADGLTNVSYSYQWIRSDGNIDTDIAGETASTYTLVSADEGKTIKVRVSFTDDADNQETLTSAATAAVAARPNSPATGLPTISGTPQAGQTLTANTTGISDADGLDNVDYSYQWIRNDGTTDTDIQGATSSTYTLSDADEGKTIKVRVSFTDRGGYQETLTSTTTIIVDQPGTVSLWPEQPRVGTVVSATLTDPDGLEGAGSGAAASLGAVSWQWARSSEGSTWTSVDVYEDGDSYTPAEDDEGMWLKVTAVYTDGHGKGKSAEAITAAMVGAREASPELTVTELVTGLTYPWDIAFTPDGTMLFTERDDGLRVRLTDGTVRQVTADFSDLNFGGTAGLLALVLDPDFVSNRRFYTYQRHTGAEMQLIAWTIDADYTTATRVADPLVGGIPVNLRNRGPSHGGGRLRFGPQGYLWVATGDGYSGTAAQDLSSLGGKVLRVDSQTGAGAPDNPFAPSPIYTYGHRNPQGLALRPGTSQMWSVEHGPDHDDEINLLVSGGNYGWDPAPDEGAEDLYDETTTPMTDLVKFPDGLEAKWSSGYPTLAVGGGVFLEGSQWRAWEGRFAVATLKTRSVRVFKFTEEGDLVSQVVVPELDRTYGRLRTAVLGPYGSLYITTTNGGGKDKILKVVPTNTQATGAPVINGTAQVGGTLTADTSGIADADGLTNVSYTYQWIANDGTKDADLGGQTGSTYILTDEDVGKSIKVRVSFTDDAENQESLTSAATATVVARPNTPVTGAPTISGTAQVGETLTADTSGIADADGLTKVSYSHQWLADDANIQGATNSTYTLADSDEGKAIKVKVSFTDDANNVETLTSAATAVVASRSDKPVADEEAPVWSADMSVVGLGNGAIGAVRADLFSNVGGSAGLQAKWLWYYTPDRELRLAFTDVVPGDEDLTLQVGDIALALQAGDSNYTWEDVDIVWEDGQTISVRIVRTSVTVAAHPNSPATGLPTISGTARVGETLTADTSSIADTDGLTKVSYIYQWIRNDGNTDAEIAGETASTYTLVSADQGKAIKVKVSFTDDSDNEEALTSATTAAVEAKPNSPATGSPAISGTVQVGQTLTADTSNIADADGLTKVSYIYQWIRSDGNTDADIAGETASTYTLVTADQGKSIKVRVTFTDDQGNEETLTSAATAEVAAKPNSAPTGLPTINGTAQVGETLSVDTSAIADEDGLTNVSYSHQWLADDANIQGATNSTYTLADSDEGKAVKVKVSFTDDRNNEESSTSAPTAAVAATVPGTPQRLNVTVHDTGALDVSWEAPASDGGSIITGHKVQWKESANSWATSADVSEETATGTPHTITGLTDGVEYTVRVMAVNDVGEGPPSAEASGTPQEAAIWSAALTVGVVAEKFAGYTTFLRDSKVLGAFSPDNITFDGASYTVKALGVLDGKLIFSVMPKLTADFVLVVGTTEFASTDASTLEGDSILQFQWSDPGLDWSEGDEVAVSLGAPDDGSPATGGPTISGTAQVDETLTADTSGIADADGLTNVSFSYQWIRNDGNTDTDIAGETDSTYTLVFADQGKSIKVRVSFTDDANNAETLTSAATGVVATKPNTPATGAPTIDGTARVGETLTVDTSGIADSDGLDNATFSYRWIRDDGGMATDIAGETDSTYTLVSADTGKTVKVRVSFTDDADNQESLTSAYTDTVAATKPGVPGRLNVFPHDAGALDVYWEAPASDGGSAITGYKVRWKESADSWDTPADVSEATASGTIHTITGLTDGVEYSVRVLATNGVGDSPPSVEQTGTPRETKAPEMVRPRVDGATLKVLYDEALDEGSAPPTDSFDVRVTCTCDDTTWLDEEAKRAVESVSVDGDTVVLTLVSAATSEDVVVVSYTPSSDAATARTRDLAGNAAAGFNSTEVFNDTDETAESEENGEPEETTEGETPLTVSLEATTESHNGSAAFTFEIRFSEEVKLSYVTLRDHAFSVTDGTVTRARRLTQGSNIGWTITVTPDSAAAVTVVLPVTTDCDVAGAVCTGDGRKLSNRLEITVSGPGQ